MLVITHLVVFAMIQPIVNRLSVIIKSTLTIKQRHLAVFSSKLKVAFLFSGNGKLDIELYKPFFINRDCHIELKDIPFQWDQSIGLEKVEHSCLQILIANFKCLRFCLHLTLQYHEDGGVLSCSLSVA